MFRTNRLLLAIPVVALMSVASVFGGSPAVAAPAPVPDSDYARTAIGRQGVSAASGELSASIDPDSVVAKPTHGGTVCRLTDHTTLTLTGSVVGTVEGSTTAYVQASCDDAIKAGPGAYPTTFTLRGTFHGTVASQQASGKVVYSGTVRAGGNVSAVFALKGRASAVLKVQSQIGNTGTYEGITMTPSRS